MAMIDYGALVFKNGKFINQGEFFMDMEKSVGWVDYPFKRYSNCDHTEDGYSVCEKCPKAHFEVKTFEGEEYKSYTTDCQNNPINRTKAGIDVVNGNYFAYVGDKHITFAFYKSMCSVYVDGKHVETIWGCVDNERHNHKVLRLEYGGAQLVIRALNYSVMYATVTYNGDIYHVIYGYGIDNDMEVWKRIKVRYLGRKLSKEIDKLINRCWKRAE